MSWCNSIQIAFYKAGTLSETLTVLQEAGWGFYDGGFSYLHCAYEDWPDNEASAPRSEWITVLTLLEDQFRSGQVVQMTLYWQGDGPRIEFVFMRAEEFGPYQLHLYWDASSPLIADSPLTDFTWFLERTAVPLLKSGVDIASVDCSDSN